MRTARPARSRLRNAAAAAFVTAAVAAILVAAPAQAAPTCTFDQPTATVTVAVADAETAAISRSGDAIALDGVPCDVATVANTDAVVVNGTGTPFAVIIDLSGGPFAPGLTVESDPSSEIEFTVNLPTGTSALRIVGSPAADDIVAGVGQLNLNAAEAPDDADVLIVGAPILVMEGGDGDDHLSVAGGSGTGSATTGQMDGGIANDLLIGATGGSTITGGDGVDTVDYTAATQLLNADLNTGIVQHASGSLDLLTGVENLTGSSASDTIVGSSGPNAISGAAGDDHLVGGGGDDVLNGGDGIDTADFSSSPAFVKVVLPGRTSTGDGSDRLEGIEAVIGSPFGDQLFGDDGPNRLDGGPGDDRIEGAGGDDTLIGGDGIDAVFYMQSSAGVTVDLGKGTATGVGADTLTGFENVVGSSGDDTINGTAGPNVLNGGDGDDTIEGADGDDRIRGGGNADLLFGQSGNDVLTAGAGSDQLNGGKGSGDECRGGAEADSFVFCEYVRLK